LSKDPEKIGLTILEALDRMGFSERLRKQEAVAAWGRIVGDVLAAETRALKIDGDTLVVKVHQAAWRQQLVFLKDDFLKKLSDELSEDTVKDIRFV
jgi:predicted nucleic acid-binding Zn ribbon protein